MLTIFLYLLQDFIDAFERLNCIRQHSIIPQKYKIKIIFFPNISVNLEQQHAITQA